MLRKKAGIIVPSSNTVLEPAVAKVASRMELDVFVTRLSVSVIDESEASRAQFRYDRFLEASRLLAEADVDVIAWGGTSGGWLGLEWDQTLCRRIEEETGIPAITATAAQFAAYQAYGVRQTGLFVPYVDSMVDPIARNFREAGVTVDSEVHLDLTVNTDFAEISESVMRSSLARLARKSETVSAFCTNLAAASLVEPIEKEFDILMFDSVLVLCWAIGQAVGFQDSIPGWGRLLRENPGVFTDGRLHV